MASDAQDLDLDSSWYQCDEVTESRVVDSATKARQGTCLYDQYRT
jgi:hypothetical protein